MSTNSSIAQLMAWNWVVQSLSNFNQFDTSSLTGLVEKAPVITDDSREMVSLQVLESLFVNGDKPAIATHSSQNPKISFDPSDQCTNVLHRILPEASEPITELEREKWDVHPFIMHKRASLPEFTLQKLKEDVVEGSHPLLASLKEMSHIGDTNVLENSQDGQNSQNTFPEVNFDSNETTASMDDVAIMIPANENNKLQDIPFQIPDHVDNSTSKTTENIKEKENEMSIEEDILMDDHGQHELTSHDDNVPKDTYIEEHDKSGTSEDGRKDMENTDSESDKDDDDEMIDIDAKKEAFLNSQYTQSQDSMATFDSTEIIICMKCNKGGRLLVCSSATCQIRVHKSCLGSCTTVDENGRFLCPFCGYSHAISKYLEVKKKASLARKDLQAFISSGVKLRPKMPSDKRSWV